MVMIGKELAEDILYDDCDNLPLSLSVYLRFSPPSDNTDMRNTDRNERDEDNVRLGGLFEGTLQKCLAILREGPEELVGSSPSGGRRPVDKGRREFEGDERVERRDSVGQRGQRAQRNSVWRLLVP